MYASYRKMLFSEIEADLAIWQPKNGFNGKKDGFFTEVSERKN